MDWTPERMPANTPMPARGMRTCWARGKAVNMLIMEGME